MKGAFFSVCGCEGLAAVLLVTLGRRAPLGPITDTFTILLARLARRIARRSTTSVG